MRQKLTWDGQLSAIKDDKDSSYGTRTISDSKGHFASTGHAAVKMTLKDNMENYWTKIAWS